MISHAHWMPPPAAFTLAKEEVHIWRISLDVQPATQLNLAALLDEHETLRAERFLQQRDRHHFIVGRGTLRVLLGRYLRCSPAEVILESQQLGKPVLPDSKLRPQIHFNLSHSQGIAVYAFALHHELGIDIEGIRTEVAVEEIAGRFFSVKEREELLSLPASSRVEGFFNAWTRKEAYIKAHGKGLHIPLDSFDVSLSPGQPVVLNSHDSDRWQLHAFKPGTDYAAAIVTGAAHSKIQFYEAELLLQQLDGV
jgi:4'-phosphopantetheinyl transferase